jgi:hypothetical protein
MAIKPIPRDVNFTERDDATVSVGKVIKVISVDETFDFGDYRKEAQLIEWEDGSKSIRFGYYMKDHGAPENQYQWGSQTALILKLENAEKFLYDALKLIKD